MNASTMKFAVIFQIVLMLASVSPVYGQYVVPDKVPEPPPNIPPAPPCEPPGRWVKGPLGMRSCECPDGSVPNWPTEHCTATGKATQYPTEWIPPAHIDIVIGKEASSFHSETTGYKIKLDGKWDGDLRITHTARDDIFLGVLLGNAYKNEYAIEKSSGLKNAIALIWKGKRYIVYDPVEYGGTQNDNGRILVFAHEAGHHICKHTTQVDKAALWDRELEADSVAGNLVRDMELRAQRGNVWAAVTIREIVSFAQQTYSKEGSRTHPPRQKRIEAILEGYHNGHRCRRR